MKYSIIKTLAVLLLLLPGFSSAYASDKDFPASPNPPRLVNDLAQFMNSSQAAQLEEKLLRFEDSTSNQITIVTVQSIGPYEIADYSVELFNRWKIGTAKNKNGVLLLAAKDERKIWITTGYGLEGALPDGLLGQIIREQIEPSFKEGNFYDGFDKGVTAIMQASRGEYKGTPHRKGNDGRGGGGIGLGITIFIIILVLVAVVRGGGRGGGGGGGLLNSLGWIAAAMLSDSNRRSSGFGGGGFGGGSSGGGGFGGFGGGSSGGGGAGGSW